MVDNANECLPIGGIISCKSSLGKSMEGEVLAFDYRCKGVIIKSCKSNTVHIVNLNQVSHLKVVSEPKVAAASEEDIPTLDFNKIEERYKREKMKREKHINMFNGVTPAGQKLYWNIIKTLDETHMDSNGNIIIMGLVKIGSPYTLESCVLLQDTTLGRSTLAHVKNIVKKYYSDIARKEDELVQQQPQEEQQHSGEEKEGASQCEVKEADNDDEDEVSNDDEQASEEQQVQYESAKSSSPSPPPPSQSSPTNGKGKGKGVRSKVS